MAKYLTILSELHFRVMSLIMVCVVSGIEHPVAELTLHHRLMLAMQTDSSGWPETAGSYQMLIERAECAAGSLALVSTTVPGLLKDTSFAEAQLRLSDYDDERADRILQLLVARQQYMEARLADPQDRLDIVVIIPDDVMTGVARVDKKYMVPQAARLLLAAEQGYDIRMVEGPRLRATMAEMNMNTSLIARRLPGTPNPFVYREYDDREPHESIHEGPKSVRAADILLNNMLAHTLRPAATRTILRTYATYKE